jgi:hypothetical protein
VLIIAVRRDRSGLPVGGGSPQGPSTDYDFAHFWEHAWPQGLRLGIKGWTRGQMSPSLPMPLGWACWVFWLGPMTPACPEGTLHTAHHHQDDILLLTETVDAGHICTKDVVWTRLQLWRRSKPVLVSRVVFPLLILPTFIYTLGQCFWSSKVPVLYKPDARTFGFDRESLLELVREFAQLLSLLTTFKPFPNSSVTLSWPPAI